MLVLTVIVTMCFFIIFAPLLLLIYLYMKNTFSSRILSCLSHFTTKHCAACVLSHTK